MKISLAKLLRPLLAVSCAGLIGSSASAAGPNTLLVVRASDNTLWKATCTAGVCGGFTNFPGLFGSQPTVTWEERNQTWLLFGTAPNGTLWKSTFNDAGTFLNDWVQIPGLAANPPGAASRGLAKFDGSTWGSPGADVTMTSHPFNTGFNLGTLSMSSVNASGYHQCTATGMVSFYRSSWVGDNVAFLGLSTTAATLETGRWTAIDLPDGTPTGLTTIPISVTAWFSASASVQTLNIIGMWRGGNGAPITMRNLAYHCEYYPYVD